MNKLIALLVLLPALGTALAQAQVLPPAPATQPASRPATQPDDPVARPELVEGVAALIRQLGDDDFARREEASKKLLALGESARPALMRTRQQKDIDAEVSARIEAILGVLDTARVVVDTAALEKLGCRLVRDRTAPGDPVVIITCGMHQITDADLERLRSFAELKRLSVAGNDVTDAALAHIKDLKKLQSLSLGRTLVTDAGLAQLKELKGLNTLNLEYTKVTDAGLAQLKELQGLRTLDLGSTKVTDAGKEELRRALPQCKIH